MWIRRNDDDIYWESLKRSFHILVNGDVVILIWNSFFWLEFFFQNISQCHSSFKHRQPWGECHNSCTLCEVLVCLLSWIWTAQSDTFVHSPSHLIDLLSLAQPISRISINNLCVLFYCSFSLFGNQCVYLKIFWPPLTCWCLNLCGNLGYKVKITLTYFSMWHKLINNRGACVWQKWHIYGWTVIFKMTLQRAYFHAEVL